MDLDIDQIIAEQDAAARARSEVAAMVEASGSIELLHRRISGWAAAVTRDPSKPGRWRMTRFDSDGASGHIECATAADAVREAWDAGFRVVHPGAVEFVVLGGS